jgi:putative membrane protein
MNAKHFILGGLLVAAPAFAQQDTAKSTHDMARDTAGQMNDTAGQMKEKASNKMAQAEKLPRADVDLLKKLHQANREEIELGQVAQEQSQRDDVKQFGKMLVDDHKMADEKVTAMADKHGVPLGDESQAMKEADKLRKKTGDEFDKEFLTQMVKGHDKVISAITSKSNDLKAELQAMTNDMLPTLRKHRAEAKRLLDEVKTAKTASTGSRQGRSDRIRH